MYLKFDSVSVCCSHFSMNCKTFFTIMFHFAQKFVCEFFALRIFLYRLSKHHLSSGDLWRVIDWRTSFCENVDSVTLGNHLILTKCQISAKKQVVYTMYRSETKCLRRKWSYNSYLHALIFQAYEHVRLIKSDYCQCYYGISCFLFFFSA